MSDCQNCFNGCADIISDKCVKYTGIAIPELGIQTGDTLSFVEQALFTFLLSALNGTGIKIDVSELTICTLVQKYLPTCGDLTIVDISKALIQASCDLQEQVDVAAAELVALNANYDIGCLTGVTAGSDTHNIVQAVIIKLCALQLDVTALELDVTALELDLATNYVSIEDINGYIAAYLASVGATTLISSKMVPYSILPFYGDLAGKFDATGAGLGDWNRIFLCNGLNSTPDLRGRIPVGVTSMLGAGFPSQTQPGINGNPDYSTKGIVSFGANQITLNSTQIPSHTHIAALTSNGEHTHIINEVYNENTSGTKVGSGGGTIEAVGTQITSAAGEHTHTIAINPTGGGLAHSNIQPVISVYYIIYIP